MSFTLREVYISNQIQNRSDMIERNNMLYEKCVSNDNSPVIKSMMNGIIRLNVELMDEIDNLRNQLSKFDVAHFDN